MRFEKAPDASSVHPPRGIMVWTLLHIPVLTARKFLQASVPRVFTGFHDTCDSTQSPSATTLIKPWLVFLVPAWMLGPTTSHLISITKTLLSLRNLQGFLNLCTWNPGQRPDVFFIIPHVYNSHQVYSFQNITISLCFLLKIYQHGHRLSYADQKLWLEVISFIVSNRKMS